MKNLLIENIKIYFGKDNVNFITESLCRCENKDKDSNTYQIIYLHLSDEWIHNDYLEFIEGNILEDYYKNEGFLQWNFYFYVVSSEDVIQSNLLKKSIIEKNDDYCRKLILTDSELIDLFESYDNISRNNEEIDVDLYSLWVNKLRDEQLFFVFNDVTYPNYKKPIEEYLEGKTFRDFEKPVKQILVEEPKISFLKELELIKFREFPSKRKFSLGEVNLIFGPNAVGKTSFFDAVELSLTGSVNSKIINGEYNLFLKDVDNNKFEYPLIKKELYKSRDNSWYSSGLNRGNRLNANFNRFNYFFSDTAFMLKKSDDENDETLERLISDVALGRDVNKLEERIKSFRDKFDEKIKELRKDKNNLNDILKEKKRLLDEFNNRSKTFDQYKTSLQNSLINNNWKKIYDFQKNEFIIELDDELHNLKNNVDYIKNKNISIKTLSTKFVNAEVIKLKKSLEEVQDLEKIINDSENKKNQNINLQKRLSEVLNDIEELERYQSNEYFENLFTIDEKIKNLELEINKNASIINLIESVFDSNLTSTFDGEKKLFEIEQELIDNKDFNLQKRLELKNQITQFENNIEELSIIVSNIKSSGKTFIIKNPNSHNCPLCNTNFEYNDLEKAILSTKNSFANSNILISLKNNLEITNFELNNIEQNLISVKELKKLYLSLFNDDNFDKSINTIRKECKKVIEINPKLSNDLLKLNSVNNSFINQNINLKVYFNLVETIKSYHNLDNVDKLDLPKLKLKVLDDIKVCNFSLASNDSVIFLNRTKLLKHPIFFTFKTTDDISKTIKNLLELGYCLSEIERSLNIQESLTILEISEYVNNIIIAYDNYKKAFLLIREIAADDDINEEIAKIESDVEVISTKLEKGLHAFKILDSIIKNSGKEIFLDNYIHNNKNEITSIFKMIHSPQEFHDIDFNNGKINLLDNNGDIRNLGEISTGQRSALALSVFLSLNKKLRNGPDLIMFDDPVTYINDLNVLTFFDYLREVVLKTNRQVFFATANEDIAFLFEKKFEFLKNKFVIHSLDRVVELESN